MKHAGPQTLEALEPLLKALRTIPGLVERKRGIFYRGGAAFLHFHEDAAGTFADLRSGADFERFAVNSRAEIARLLRAARTTASAPRMSASAPHQALRRDARP
jgi:hypothetical protein